MRVDRTPEVRRRPPRRQCHHDCHSPSHSPHSVVSSQDHDTTTRLSWRPYMSISHFPTTATRTPPPNMPFLPQLSQRGRGSSANPPSPSGNCVSRRDCADPTKKSSHHFSLGQVLLVGLGCASFAAVSTAWMAVLCLNGLDGNITQGSSVVGSALGGLEAWSSGTPTTRMMTSNSEVRLEENSANSHDSQNHVAQDSQPGPKVAWLMSFPNSGTSFTIHMTREATNMTTATNYALEGEIKDQPSVQAIPGKRGAMGPFLELIPDRNTTVPSNLILTKTHCKGFCNGRNCGPDKTVHTVRSFMTGCLTGKRAISTPNGGIKPIPVTYDASLVKKAIHVMRHPLDNIVARFHLEYNVQTHIRGNKDYGKVFPKNQDGFRRWCAADDANHHILHSHFLAYDHKLREKMSAIPCMNDFFRYVQWHNLAFSTSRDLNLPTMMLHYHEYSEDFPKARGRVLDWLELDRVGEGIEFHSGKVYRHYYTNKQKIAIREFLQEFASAETWEQLKDYDFEIKNQENNVHGASAE